MSDDLSPLVESDFAVRHGIVGASPDVVIAGPAVRRGREGAGLSPHAVALAMSRRGYSIDAAEISDLEDDPAHRLRPREARLLAAVLELPLAAIESRPVPWPAASADVSSLTGAGVTVVVVGDDVAVTTDNGSTLGLLRCAGGPDVLDSRTYRAAAAALLTGTWSHLAGALLVTEHPPHLAVAVDALDCTTRPQVPSGLAGFSRLAEPRPLVEAVALYDQTYAVTWSDPEPLASLLAPSDGAAGGIEARLGELVEDLQRQARRARQPGKRPGYEAAATWLDALGERSLTELLGDLAELPPDEARRKLEEELP